MTTEGNKRAKGSKPGTLEARLQLIVEAINAKRPTAAATVIDEGKRGASISIYIGGNTSARFKGHAGTWRANVFRLLGDTPVDTGSKLVAANAIAYQEKDAGKVADALLVAVDRCRGEILDHSLMLDVAERVNELRPGSEAVVEADSPGVHYVDFKFDERHRIHYGHDITWGGSLMLVVNERETEYADVSFPTEVPYTETDAGRIAAAIVEAIKGFTPQN
jgi:hypothetical protein